MEAIRKTDLGKEIYARRIGTAERIFADAKEKHSMRYTHYRGLSAVTRWVRLKLAAMNLKKLANQGWSRSFFSTTWLIFTPEYIRTRGFAYSNAAQMTFEGNQKSQSQVMIEIPLQNVCICALT